MRTDNGATAARHPWLLAAVATPGVVLLSLASLSALPAPQQAPPRAALPAPRAITSRVTAVSGPSWLERLRISFDRTSMGRMGQNTPPPTVRYEPKWNQLAGSEDLNERFVLSGSDLYRLDCESCHQPDGRGSPPEIHSLQSGTHFGSPLERRACMCGRGDRRMKKGSAGPRPLPPPRPRGTRTAQGRRPPDGGRASAASCARALRLRLVVLVGSRN